MTEQDEIWPPPIQHEAVAPAQHGQWWVRRFVTGMKIVYLLFIPFLFCLLVPPVRNAIQSFELNFVVNRHSPPYDLAFFRFTAGCFVVASIIGTTVSGIHFLVATSRHERLQPYAIGFVASVIPGSVSYYFAYLEFCLL